MSFQQTKKSVVERNSYKLFAMSMFFWYSTSVYNKIAAKYLFAVEIYGLE